MRGRSAAVALTAAVLVTALTGCGRLADRASAPPSRAGTTTAPAGATTAPVGAPAAPAGARTGGTAAAQDDAALIAGIEAAVSAADRLAGQGEAQAALDG